MKNPRKSSVSFFLGAFSLLAAAGSLGAQGAAEEIPMIDLSVCNITSEEMPALYVMNELEQFVPLPIGDFSRGTSIGVPKADSVVLYTGTFDEEGEPNMKPAITIPTAGIEDKALLLVYNNPDGSMGQTTIDDSETAHPANSVRVLNVSPYPMTFSAGTEPKEVAPRQQAIVNPQLDENRRFAFVYRSVLSDGEVYTSPIKKLSLRSENARLLVLYTALKKVTLADREDSNSEEADIIEYEPTAYRLYDKI